MATRNPGRLTLDCTMTLLTLLLMGGNYFFPWEGVHEILGAALLVLWAVHTILNRRWYGSLRRGTYTPYRIMQTAVNCGILVCALFLAASGIMLSNYVFAFLHLSGGTAFARTAHLLASHWYYVLMSLHIGLHVRMIARRITRGKELPPAAKAAVLAATALICAYGIYALVSRGVWQYLILRQQFFFLDLEKGYVRFLADYAAIVVLIAAVSHLLACALTKAKK